MHALGFQHNPPRLNKNKIIEFLQGENKCFLKYFSQELEGINPLSVMLYDESEEMKRINGD